MHAGWDVRDVARELGTSENVLMKCERRELGYALQYYPEPEDFWRNVIFMNEKKFSTVKDGRR